MSDCASGPSESGRPKEPGSGRVQVVEQGNLEDEISLQSWANNFGNVNQLEKQSFRLRWR